MRFGISLISWMLPKILRIRRAAAVWPLFFLAGASIALVAMIFPALCGAQVSRRSTVVPRRRPEPSSGHLPSQVHDVGALLPALPPQCVEPVRLIGPCPGEDGKSPGRTSPRGQSRYVLDLSHIRRWAARARAAGHEKAGRLGRSAPPFRAAPRSAPPPT